MVDYRRIYDHHALDYERLVSAEDFEGHLAEALSSTARLEGARVIEVGAGTGRLTRLLAGRGARVIATERAAAMAGLARGLMGDRSKETAVLRADARALPCRAGWADIAIAGWVFGHLRHWFEPGWREEIGRGLGELDSALRPGGTLIVIETLGTGREEPAPPNEALAEYYSWLEGAWGMERRWLRTDYRFESVEEAAEVCGLFFGAPFGAEIRRNRWRQVPECTGLWWRSSSPPE